MNHQFFYTSRSNTLFSGFSALCLTVLTLLSDVTGSKLWAQCDAETSGVYTYCNSFHDGNPVTGYFVAFRVKDLTGDTLDVVDVNGVVPTNQGKRIDDINTEDEPDDYTVQQLMISGAGADTLEFWYFGPYPNGSTFDIALVDPDNVCDTIFIATGTYDCADNSGISDPGACDADVPLYFLDFSLSEFIYGGGGGGNENLDEIFLIMARSRENFCCDLQPDNQRCFEFIIRLDDDDIGLSIDDVGSGSTGGEFYADTLNAFACTGNSVDTWPFTQSGGQSSDLPLCLGFEGQEFIVLSCKSGNNVTAASIDALSNIFSPPEATIEPCNVSLQVFNVDSVMWSSDDDPTLANLISCTGDSTFCMFFYDTLTFGQVTACEGDTFTYIVGGMPAGNECIGPDSLLFDTTYVVVYPVFTVEIDSLCTGDSLLLTAVISSPAIGCDYAFDWSNGDTTQSITVPFSTTEYFVTVTRADLPPGTESCVVAMDSVIAEGSITVDCSQIGDTIYFCVDLPPDPDTSLVLIGGCSANVLIFTIDISNNASGCQADTLTITRYYIVDFDGDTITTTTDRDTCTQILRFVDDVPPSIICPSDVTVLCTGSTTPANTGSATATDICDDTLDITSNDITIAGSCPQEFTINRTWKAEDDCGNSSTCLQVIQVEDNTPPSITCPPHVTIECTASTLPVNTGTASGSDTCDGTPAFSFSDMTVVGACPQEYTIIRTWSATDDCGNTSTCNQIIMIADNNAPVITCPANTTIECDESTLPGNTGEATASDICDPNPTIFFFDYTGTSPSTSPEMRWIFLPPGTNAGTCTSNTDCASGVLCFALQYTPGVSGTLTSYTTGFFVDCYNGLDPVLSNTSCVMTDNSAAAPDCGGTGTVLINSSGNAGALAITQNVPVILHQVCIQLAAGGSTLLDEDEITDLSTSVDLVNNGVASEFPSFTNFVVDFDAYCSEACPYPATIFRQFVAVDDCDNQSTCIQVITIQDETMPVFDCPANITVECDASTAPASTGTATATDNCDTTLTITYADLTIGGQCPQEYTIVRTWSSTDICGNTGSCVQIITVDDSVGPSMTCPANVTVECTASTMTSNTGDATATDNCDASVIIFFDDVTIAGNCPQEYTINRTFGAIDDCGNSSSCTQLIFIEDSANPAINCPSDITIECSASTLPANTGSASGSDVCDGTPTFTFSDVTISGACPQEYTITRTWTATDDCGNSSTCNQIIQLDDSLLPSISCPANTTIQCSDSTLPANTGSATGSDNCDGTPSFTFTDITMTGSCPHEYTITRTWRATDDCGNSSTCNQVITIEDSIPPSLTCPANITIQCTESTAPANTGSATATDACDPVPIITSSDITVGGLCPQEYTINRTWRATDACGNSSSCLQTIFIDDSIPPVLTCPPNITIDCAASTMTSNTGNASATDNCDTTPLLFFNDVTIAGGCPQEYTIQRTFGAMDDCGNTSTCLQIIQLDDTTPPAINCPANVTVSCANQVPPVNIGSVTTSDNCGSVTVTHDGDVTSSLTCTNRFTLTRTYRATDACGNTATCNQIIIVNDQTPPVIGCPANVTVACASNVPPVNVSSVFVNENCGGQVTVVHLGDVISNQTCINRYTISRTYRASDVCGNSASCTQTITVNDQSAPIITCPVNVTIQCTASTLPGNTGTATATDNCNGIPVISSTDVTVAGACPQEYTITRTWRAMDECGNSSTCNQTILVDDSTAPSIVCPVNVTIQCNTSTLPSSTGSASATDNCDVTPIVTSTDVTIAGGCPQEYTINRTWRATDDCGNSSSCLQTIFVDDSTAPSITCPAPVTVSCANQVPAPNTGSVTSSDNCGTVTIIHVGDATTNLVCVNQFTLTRTYRSTDTCGNSSTCTQTITVNDQTPPVITCPSDITIVIEESTLPGNTGNPIVSDNCGGTPVVTFGDMTAEGACADDYMITRTWLASDACGNSASCIQMIAVSGGCIVDLSLTKDLDPNQGEISGGDNVNFTITITNDGEQDISSVTIIDYIPIGFSLNDPDWIAGNEGSTGQSATITLSVGNGGLDADGLNPGESISVQITLLADPDIPGGVYVNIAEILTVINANGEDVTDEDIDSTPDNDDINDPDAEDDHDIAEICILPEPVIIGDNFVCPEELVQYSIENYNPLNTYIWTLSGGGIIVEDNGSNIVIQWQEDPGGPFQVSVTEVAGATCQASTFLMVFIQGVEPIACNDHIQISLDADGVIVVLPGMILEGENEMNNNYYVVITDQDGNIVPDATLDCSHVGQTFMVSVHNICNSQSCWGTISVEDKLPPQIICECPVGNAEPECEVNCLQVELLEDGVIPAELLPTVIDNCPEVQVEILAIEVNDEGCGGGYIIVTWKATDIGGNTATCTQQFNIIPLTLETLTFPVNYIGECNTSIHPSVTGWPQIDGLNLTDNGGICNIFAGYWDKELADCGGGRKIQRTWTVLDWCTQEIAEGIQVIKLTDSEGPELGCPADITVGTDFWYCYANFSVPKPTAHDVCSEIESYVLTSSAGTVVAFGENYVIHNLPIGTHFITWAVTDECGNSNTCSFKVTVEDDVVPVALCDQHTIVSLTNDGPSGVTLVPAEVFDDGSYDNCGPVTFRARRMDSCIDFDWTTEGACIDDIPGGIPAVNSRDRGTVHKPCVPFACCDVDAGPIMVELEVTDAAGNVNYCMIEAIVQDKISAYIECPQDIIVSCDYWFNVQEGIYADADGNHNGNLDEDPLSNVFGNMYDAFVYDESIRDQIVIHDPGNTEYFQPHTWGLDGWADDNCEVELQVRVRVYNDCSGEDLPGNPPPGAIKLIERRFSAGGVNDGSAPATCTQRIWVVDFKPFYISDQNCNNNNPNDGVIWPCDIVLASCPDDINGTGEPVIFDDACSLIGVTYEDTRFDFVDGACFKILRDWAIIDWCQYNAQTGAGLWHYTQVIKVHDEEGPQFQDCPVHSEILCLADPGVSLPDNNQVFLGEENPSASGCGVHLDIVKTVYETCSDAVQFDVKIFLFNGTDFIQVQGTTSTVVDSNNTAQLRLNTRQSPIQSIRTNGLPYNSPWCGNYHKILWSVEDGCGNWSHCEYLLRLEDCKQPSPVCINGLSTVVMPISGQVTIWAKDFNASSVDDCASADELLYSFSGDAYQPSFTFTCDNVPAFGVELTQQIWVADGGVDHNCNGQIEWGERNKDFCTTTIVIHDNMDVCDQSGSILAGEILTEQSEAVEKVNVYLTTPGHAFPTYVTADEGKFRFTYVPEGEDYTITPERNDNAKNGVSTLDLVRIQKHLLGIEPFTSPYQYIAADANNSQQVSAIDLIEIRKLILGIYTRFPNNQSWRFVEKGYDMEATHPWPFGEQIQVKDLSVDSMTHNDFVAVKIADVNNSAQANAALILPRNGNRVLQVTTDEISVVEGQTVRMKLDVPETLLGFQWTMETDGLEFIGVTSDDIAIRDEHTALPEDEKVTMSWNGDFSAYGNREGVFEMIVEWKATRAGALSEMVRLTGSVTPAEAYAMDGEILDVRLRFNSTTRPQFALHQNRPNPWNGQTVIGFDLPEATSAILKLYDPTGKEILTIQGSYQAGYNSIVLTDKQLPPQGVLYYKLESGAFAASKKMVIIK